MKKLNLFSIISIYSMLLFFLMSCSQHLPKEDTELLEKLVFHNAYAVVAGYNDKLEITATSYKVKLKYPSKDVLEFCDKRLEELGWIKQKEYVSEAGIHDWSVFIDGTIENEPLVHKLSATWADKNKHTMVTLLMKYYSYNFTKKEKIYAAEPSTDILNVIVQVGPYVKLPVDPKAVLRKD